MRRKAIVVMAQMSKTVILLDALASVTNSEARTTREKAIARSSSCLRRNFFIRHFDVAESIILLIIYHVLENAKFLVISVGARPKK